MCSNLILQATNSLSGLSMTKQAFSFQPSAEEKQVYHCRSTPPDHGNHSGHPLKTSSADPDKVKGTIAKDYYPAVNDGGTVRAIINPGIEKEKAYLPPGK
jgi:hypothetical protein